MFRSDSWVIQSNTIIVVDQGNESVAFLEESELYQEFGQYYQNLNL